MLFLLGLWVVLSIVVGMVAHSRGRGRITWLLFALLVSPLIAAILLFSARDLVAEGIPTARPSTTQRVLRVVANLLMLAAVLAIFVSLLGRGGMKPIRLSHAAAAASLTPAPQSSFTINPRPALDQGRSCKPVRRTNSA